MNRDVFLSLLAMDSYNRRYNQGLANVPNMSSIGTAAYLKDSVAELGASSANSGFYAIAYNWNGEKVISYRGTDPSNFSQLYRDLAHGWSTFTGLGNSSQFGLARQFFNQVTHADFLAGTAVGPAIVITTGRPLPQ